jgi:hypothetical protein
MATLVCPDLRCQRSSDMALWEIMLIKSRSPQLAGNALTLDLPPV